MPIIEFDTKMRGYDPQQVNDAVTNFQDTINKYAQANTDLKRTLDTVNNQFTQANQDIDQLQAENKKLSERIEELEKQNDDLEAKLKNKYTSVGDDVRKLLEDTQTVYHAAEKNAADIKNKALQEAENKKAEVERQIEEYLNMTSHLEEHLDNFEFDIQLVKSLVQKIEVSADKRIRIVFGFQDVFTELGKESAET